MKTKNPDEISYRDLLSFYLDTLDYMVTLLEVDYSMFRGHAHLVAFYSKLIASELNLPKKTIDEIVLASYLHDFGKILIKKEKKGDGSDLDETTLVLDFLKKLNPPFNITEILTNIKECYDGSGPKRLKGSEIHIGARIISVIETFEEEAKRKTDTKHIEKEKAFRILRDSAGKKLDPDIVRRMINIVKNEFTYDKATSYIKEKPLVCLFFDDSDLASLLKLRLIKEGYNPVKYHDFESGANELQANNPSLVIIETKFLIKFKDFLRNTYKRYLPFIIISEKGDTYNYAKALAIGAEDLLKKPVDVNKIFESVSKFFGDSAKKGKMLSERAGFFEKTKNFYKAGDIYRELGDLENAAIQYEKANDYNLAASMYLAINKPEAAARLYEMAKNYEMASKYYGDAGNFLKQNEILEKLGDFYSAALNFYNSNRLEEAIPLFQKVEKDSKNYKKSQHQLGKIFFEKNENKMACDFLIRAIDSESINRVNINSFYYLGKAFEAQGKLEKAIDIYEKILGESYDYLDVLELVEKARANFEKDKEREEKEKEAERFIIPIDVLAPTKKRYERLSEVGRGGMGVVYKAKDMVLDRIIALKVLSAVLQKEKKVVETFIREAKSAARLNHLNIVTVHDAGIEEGSYYIAMEFIDGKTVREILKKKRFAIPTVIGISKQVLRGLEYAHSKQIVHRDLTTNNMMLTKNRVIKIMDFGLARVIKQLMSEQSIIGGTPSFMSPEQVEGDPIDHRSDLYTFGVSAFEMSTGRVPFKKGDLGYHHLHTPPPIPQEVNPKIPKFLNDIILKCMEKKPENRFQSAGEILEELKKY